MKTTIPRLAVKIPGPIQYMMGEASSLEYVEIDLPDDAQARAARIREIREEQVADLGAAIRRVKATMESEVSPRKATATEIKAFGDAVPPPAKPAATMPAAPVSPSIVTSQYPAGSNVAAIKRVCGNAQAHNPNAAAPFQRGVMTIAEWDYSIKNHGAPLCRGCQVTSRKL